MISLIVESSLIFFHTVSFIFVCVFIDDEHLDDNDYIESHTSRFVQRLIFAFLIACYNWKLGIASGLLMAALFDQLLNWFRDKPFWHLGNTATWDRFFNRNYFLTPTIKVWGSIILKSKYVKFKFKLLYIGVKIICLAAALFLFLNNFYTFTL
jgi:hypothetical protein